MIKSIENSADAVVAHIVQNNRKSFVWGSRDCMLFVADCLKIVTGVDFASMFRGKYNDEQQALSLIKETTGASNYLELFEQLFNEQQGIETSDLSDCFIFGVVKLSENYFGAIMNAGNAVIFQPRRYIIVNSNKFVKMWGVKWQ